MVLLLFFALLRLIGTLIAVLFVFSVQTDLQGAFTLRRRPGPEFPRGIRTIAGVRGTAEEGISAFSVELQFFAQACYRFAEYRAKENKTVETGK
jgi:hypothetical protein